MRYFTILFFLTAFLCCTPRVEEQHSKEKSLQLPDLNIIDTQFPLKIMDLDFPNVKSHVKVNDEIESELNKIIFSYYFDGYSGDSSETQFKINDIYIGTIRIIDSIQTLYMVLFHHIPGGEVNSRVLFYNNLTKTFANIQFNFNLYALYDYEEKELIPSYLKKLLKFNFPEIELIDYDKDGTNDYKFTRLLHNGTTNGIETTMLKVTNSRIDTLDFKTEWIVE